MTDGPTEREGEGAWAKLRRRKVVQWGLAYAAGAWTLLQVIQYLGDTYAWPPAIRQVATPCFALGLLFVFVLAWYHGDKGAQKVSRTELAVLATLLAAASGTMWWYASRLDEGAWVADTLAARSQKTFVPPWDVATLYAYAGDKDQCLEWHERAYAVRDPVLPWLWIPDFKSVRDDPRFRDLLKRMKLPE